MHTLGALAVTELNILTRTRKRVTSRAIHAYLGALAVTELNILTRARKRVTSRAIYAYLGRS
jgi:hypothetical protein